MTPNEIRTLRRKTLKITMAELGKLCDVSWRTIQHWETDEGKSGHRKPNGSILKILQAGVCGLWALSGSMDKFIVCDISMLKN